MKIGTVVALLVGFALAIFVIMHIGFAQVFGAVTRVGWLGFVVILITAMPIIAFLALAWRSVVGPLVPYWVFFASRQLRDSATDLLPFTNIGGIVIGVRAGILAGIPSTKAYATAVVDITCETMAQIAFTAIGLLIGFTRLKASAELAIYFDALILGTALLVPGVIAFVVLQRKGSKLAGKMAAQFLPKAVAHTENFTAEIEALYQQPKKLTLCSTYHLIAWFAAAFWLWVMFKLLGVEVDMMDCIAIESLLSALRSAAIFIPAAVGVQEAGYALVTSQLVQGVGPEIGLAVSLLKRARDVILGNPVLLIWQAVEGKRAFAAKEGDAA